jgi:hypothetical protein
MTDPDGDDIYETLGTLPTIPSGQGPIPLTINWKDKDPTVLQGNPNRSGSFYAHRVYSAKDDPAASGPVKYVKVVDPSTGDVKNSVHFNDSIGFKVKVGIEGNLAVQSQVSDPAVPLRIVGGKASNRHTLDCDPNPGIAPDDPHYTTLWEELAYGCYPQYRPNTGTSCPDNIPSLWSTPQPPAWECVAVQPGGQTNEVAKGLNQRIFLATQPNGPCPALGEIGHNNWKNDTDGDGNPDLPAGDPRALFVFLTPFGTFSRNGSYTVPVTGLAAFYVSGYTGQGNGFDGPCENDPDEDPAPGPATIVGHFMRYVFDYPGTGTGSPCITTPTVIDPCIAVLTQ